VDRVGGAGGLDDVALAHAAMRADARAPGLIWDRYSVLVRRIVQRTIGPGVDTEDLVQDVFLRFFRQIATLRDPAALRSFLVGITLRVARSELRRRRVRRWLRLTDNGVLPDVGGAHDEAAPRRALARLYAILDEIDDRARVAFVLRHFEGYELTEVAASLGCSLATTKRVLARAQERVEKAVQREPLLLPYVGGAGAARASRVDVIEAGSVLEAEEVESA
jgi:RNA polymerase sigma-70 factor (ECF subfamily)